MIKYVKITTEKHPCRSCNGQGWKWENVYHNQTKKCKCYLCTDGMIVVDKHEDIDPKMIILKPISPIQKHDMMTRIIQYQMRQISTAQIAKYLDDYTANMIDVDKHEDVTQQLSKSHNATMDTLIDFAVYLTGHDHLTVLQMFNDYSKTAHKS